MALSKEAIVEQSWNAYNQWCKQWRDHCKQHSKYKQKSLNEFANSGVGKALVLVATGYSLEKNIEELKKHKDDVDILCCDKSLGILLDNGIVPTYCLVCDANVDHDKYLKPWEDQLEETILFMNVCGNPAWTKELWKDTYFFANEDAIKSEKEFMKLSGCVNLIPAGTNVSNVMIIFATQSSNVGRQNFFGYDKILLLGYDYCWTDSGNYYAFDHDADGKRFYMKHVYAVDVAGNYVYTSNNLLFSAQWCQQYCQNFNLPIVNCSDNSMLGQLPHKTLASQLPYAYKREDKERVVKLSTKLSQYHKELNTMKRELEKIGKEHWTNFQESI